MAGEVIVDALPYIDQGYDDTGVRESALAMVEEECRRYRPTKNYLENLPPLNTTAFETPLMAQEFERIHQRLPMESISMKRYELPPPSAGRLTEVTAWEESIDNSKAQLEHQWVRAMNLELMLDYGIEAWKAYLEVFVAMQAKAQHKLQGVKKEIQDVNWQRKQTQTQAGEKLRSLEANWVLLVSKNYEIEQQCVELEKQIYALKQRIEQKIQEQEKEEEEEQKSNVDENETVDEDQVNGFSNERNQDIQHADSSSSSSSNSIDNVTSSNNVASSPTVHNEESTTSNNGEEPPAEPNGNGNGDDNEDQEMRSVEE